MPCLALTLLGETQYVPIAEQESAMRQYWAARQAGDDTAKLERVDGPEPDPPIAAEAPTAQPGVVSDIAAERIARDDGWLAEAGFALPPPLYTPGTRVIPLGDENFRLERKRVEELPVFADAADAVCRLIDHECRDDVRFELKGLVMNHDASIDLAGCTTVPVEMNAFRQLTQLAGFGCGTRYLAEFCDSRLRADNVNHQVQRLRESRMLVMRTRVGDDGLRSAYACVTPSYAAVDTNHVLTAVKPFLEDAHVEMRYDGAGITATAYWMPDEVVDLAAGDVFKVGVRISTDDTGRGRIRIEGVVWRNLCLNLIIIADSSVETVSQVHRGDPTRIINAIRGGVSKARESVGNFLEAWGHARSTEVDAEAMLRELVEKRKLDLPGVRSAEARDAIVDDLLSAWNEEPGGTVADVANALTRAAHSTGRYDHLLQEALERQAAELVLLPR